jgi:hypothetical protein
MNGGVYTEFSGAVGLDTGAPIHLRGPSRAKGQRWQRPALQVPPMHPRPQPPQLATSLLVSTQTPPQFAKPDLHATPQTPPVQMGSPPTAGQGSQL